LNPRLTKAYKAFTAKEWPAPALPAAIPGATAKARPASDVSGISALADANLTILIRALLDTQAGGVFTHESHAQEAGEDGLSAGPEAFSLVRERLEAVREEGVAKFIEFRERWRKRLAFIQLQPFLQRNQWFVQSPEGWVVAGKGTRKDAKMLYLQSLHDMASDAERQVSFVSGHVFRQESEVAALWHKESVKGNRSRLLPALEASLRNGESAVFKQLRLSLGDLAQETFTERVSKWDRRFFASETELFRQTAWPWLGPGRASGFEGFMETFADLSEALCGAMLDHYESKWGLYLRGLAMNSRG
jgi:hypothetical protein